MDLLDEVEIVDEDDAEDNDEDVPVDAGELVKLLLEDDKLTELLDKDELDPVTVLVAGEVVGWVSEDDELLKLLTEVEGSTRTGKVVHAPSILLTDNVMVAGSLFTILDGTAGQADVEDCNSELEVLEDDNVHAVPPTCMVFEITVCVVVAVAISTTVVR